MKSQFLRQLTRSFPRTLTLHNVLKSQQITPRVFNSIKNYHSTEHPDEFPYTSEESAIYNSALLHVPSEGFTDMALIKGARDKGYNDGLRAMFENGAADLIFYHLRTRRLALLDTIKANEEEFMSKSEVDRTTYLINERLKYNVPYLSKMKDGLALMTQPKNLTASIWELQQLADTIAFYAGDKSNDFSWYSKRFAIAGTYSASELFMLNDKSADFQDTRNFVERRIKNANTVESMVDNTQEWLTFNTYATLNLIRSQLVRG